MADEETLLIIVGVYEPAGDAIDIATLHFARLGLEDVHAIHFYTELAVLLCQKDDIRFAEDDEGVAFAGVLEVLGHMQVGIHAGLEYRYAAQLIELGGVRLVVEGAGNQYVEPGITRLAGGSNKVSALYGAELGADEDGGTFLSLAFQVAGFGADQLAGPGREGDKGDTVLLVRLLNAGGLEVLHDHLGEGLLNSIFVAAFLNLQWVDQIVVLINAQHAVGAEALHGEGTGHADLLLIVIWFIVEIFKFGPGSDGFVDLLLPGYAGLPPVGM